MNHNLTPPPPEDTREPASSSRAANLAAFSFKALALAFGVVLLIYLILIAWLHYHLAGQAISISQAAGATVEVEKFLGGFLFWLLAAALVPLAARLLLASLNPFRKSGAVVGRLAALIAIGLAMSLLPTGLRVLRGVDAKGLPVEMEHSNPDAARWWNPDGDPVLFFSLEHDGNLEFWNRPGTTPQTGTQSKPVTKEIRAHWHEQHERETSMLQKQEEEGRLEIARQREEAANEAKALAARQAIDRAQREEELRRQIQRERALADAASKAAKAAAELQEVKEQEHRRELEKVHAENERQRQASTPPQAASQSRSNGGGTTISYQGSSESAPMPIIRTDGRPVGRQPSGWMTVRMRPGKFIQPRGVANSRIEIRSNGHGLFQAPGFARVAFGGGTFAFHTPADNFRMYCNQNTSFLITYRWIPQ